VTTPNPPLPGTGTPMGGLGGLLSGAAGTLGGTNTLQSSIDSLTNSVNSLSGIMGRMNFAQGTGNTQQSGGNGGGGNGFPAMVNPFNNNPNTPGMGGGGRGGTGNVSTPRPFVASGVAALASAAASYGNQQMSTQLGLNAYSTISQLGMNPATGNTNGNALMRQAVGMGGQNFNVLANGGFDALQMTQQLQYAGGSPLYNSTALGRAAFGSTAGFGLTNPTLSGSQSASLAQQLYSPGVSQKFVAMGYGGSPRALGGGNPSNMGQVMQTILRGWFNKNSVSNKTLYSNLSEGGLGNANLQALGLNPTQTAPVLEGYNQLFQKGYSANQAQALFTQAAKSGSAGASARSKLTNLGVKTANSDIQNIRNAQSAVTSRSADTANGFNSALDASTKMLGQFNTALNKILDSTGANNILGGVGGASGIMSSTNHATGLLASGGTAALMMRLFGGGGAAASAAGGGGILGGSSGAALGGAVGTAGVAGAGLAGGLGASWLGRKALSTVPASQQHGLLSSLANFMVNEGVLTGKGRSSGGNILSALLGGESFLGTRSTNVNVGGGSGSVTTSAQQQAPGGRSSMGGGGQGAVAAAESQLGVPYVWGGETPGVGFDCSGLTQWAEKQAGISIPRTSQQQWASLQKKAVSTSSVQAGDLVFQAGSDGTANAPGHVGLMISRNQLIQAPHTGADVQIIGYNPRDWQHAARPGGGGSMMTATSNVGASANTGLYGNAGAGMGIGGGYGSSNEVDLISSTGGALGGGGGGTSMASGNASGPAGSMGSSASIPSGKGGIAALAKTMAAKYGWNKSPQWDDFVKVVNRESGWNVHAKNSSSGAYGIPQALPGDKMSSAGPDWQNSAATQLKWMFGYIKDRYHSPSGAWQHEKTAGWYGSGGKTKNGISIVGDRGPEIMMDGGGNTVLSNAQSMALLKATTNQPAQGPWQNMANQSTAGGQMINPLTIGRGGSAQGQININFGANAVVVKVGSTADVSASGRQIVKEIVNHLHDEDVYNAIANGEKL
jgi:hypothetical protein